MTFKRDMKTLNEIQVIDFKRNASSMGSLVAITGKKEIPIAVKRIFFVYGTPQNTSRGDHAHTQSNQVLIAQRGVCDVTVTDGDNERVFRLDSPTKGLFIPKTLWSKQLYLSEDTLLLVLTDQPYDEKEYIRDYPTFLKLRGHRQAA